MRPNASTVPPNGEAIIKVMLQPGGTDERHKFMVQSIYGKFWPCMTSNDLIESPSSSAVRARKTSHPAEPGFQPSIWRSNFWPWLPLTPFDLCFSVPDDYNQIEEKDEKKNFVNSLWADSANNPVMSSKLICVFQTENQQSKSEVKFFSNLDLYVWSFFGHDLRSNHRKRKIINSTQSP